ncbi:PAS domain S-box-containing protein [Nonomuraea maritima]|uniref:PAS domain S-box-containing protein n=1 Tax=Nonomuraea maritima TaxID=683260 RepID=A0A1G8U918_9ACTN|nr:SpoIIE family protein phosphatase [Nonomuraea maritima]SDJ50231.1 PAS domain S-box-containing protein [Nonomuraea maritima]
MTGEDARRVSDLSLGVFDSAPVGVAVFSGSGHRLVYMNDSCRCIVGARPHGVPAREMFRDVTHVTLLDRVRSTGEDISLDEVPLDYRVSPVIGQKRYASVSMSRIPLDGGEHGVMVIVAEADRQAESGWWGSSVADERHRFLQLYLSLVQLEKQALWVTDAKGEVFEPCPGWERLTGQAWEEYRGAGWQDAMHPDDRQAVISHWLDTVDRRGLWEYVYRVRRPDGAYRHVHTRAVPVIEDGEVVEWVGALTDIEQEWQEERRRKLLERAATATAHLGNLDDVLRTLVDVIVPALADGCAIFLLPQFENGSISPPFVSERLISFARMGSPPSTGSQLIGEECDFVEVIRTRQPILRIFPKGQPPPGSVPPGGEQWAIAEQANSLALVPVIVDGTVAAVVHAVVVGDRERLTAADVELLGRMLDHAHTHLNNAVRFQQTQRVALALQTYLLPDPPQVPGLEIVGRYRASTSASEIGGDWYDMFVTPDGSTILSVGDVAGHHLSAAVTMSQLRNMLRGLAMDRREPPGDILRRLNVATELLNGEHTATCVLGRLEGGAGSRVLCYSVAGHPPPLLITYEGEARFLTGAVDPMLGVAYDRPRTSSVEPLPPRSMLLFYTDGLVKVPGEHLDVGLERLRRAATCLAREPLEALCDKLLQMPMAGQDDIALLAARAARQD